MRKFEANIFETVLAILTLISVVVLFYYFHELQNFDSTQDNLFKEYDNNPGIIKISIISLVAKCVFLVCFTLLAFERSRQSKKILIVYIFSALVIGFLQWFELYYGSTFYYGEIRDKQGIMFPLFATFMVTLAICKINYFSNENRNIIIKLVLTAIINIGLYILWKIVYEPWNLWQS